MESFKYSSKASVSVTWDKIEKIYNAKLNNRHGGAGNKPARIIIGALLIKHKMGLSDEETEQQAKEYQQLMAKNVGERNEVEATFGTAKRIYKANNIRAKLPDTGASWTACCYFAKNVKKFLRELLYALILMIRKMEISVLNNENYYGIGYLHYKYALLTRV